MNLKSWIIRKARSYILGYRASSETYISYLRKKGAKIGENVIIFSPNNTTIDTTTPYMITIGNGVNITGPVTILTHDYSTHIANEVNSSLLATVRPVEIGDNCFLGWGCTILAGTTIGENTIIGAGAVVSGKVEDNSVYAGNPAKRIMSIQEYYEKRKEKQLDEAVCMFSRLSKFLGRAPTQQEMWAYRNVFLPDSSTRLFESYEKFCEYVLSLNLKG